MFEECYKYFDEYLSDLRLLGGENIEKDILIKSNPPPQKKKKKKNLSHKYYASLCCIPNTFSEVLWSQYHLYLGDFQAYMYMY